MNEKIRKGLCYNCDDKWGLDHVCKKPKVYLLHVYELTDEGEVLKSPIYTTVANEKIM